METIFEFLNILAKGKDTEPIFAPISIIIFFSSVFIILLIFAIDTSFLIPKKIPKSIPSLRLI